MQQLLSINLLQHQQLLYPTQQLRHVHTMVVVESVMALDTVALLEAMQVITCSAMQSTGLTPTVAGSASQPVIGLPQKRAADRSAAFTKNALPEAVDTKSRTITHPFSVCALASFVPNSLQTFGSPSASSTPSASSELMTERELEAASKSDGAQSD